MSTASKTNTVPDSINDRIAEYPAEHETYDVMRGAQRLTIGVDEYGDVSLMDVMPRLVPVGQTADFAVVQAARVSYGAGTKKVSDDAGLLRYLMRNQHNTPFEMVEFKFKIVAPLVVARQFHRHRAVSINEYSARYSEVRDRFYVPETAKKQSTINKQGSGDDLDDDTEEWFLTKLKSVSKECYDAYQNALKMGVSREEARMMLPLNMYTEWYFKIDLRNLLWFLRLRLDPHAQQVSRTYAQAIYELIEPIVPVSCKAFQDYQMGSITLSALEVDALRHGRALIDTTNKREQEEWKEKAKSLGLELIVNTPK